MPIDMDGDLANADWTKSSWDMPPYKSPEFFEAIGGYDQLDSFRHLPTYTAAVEAGLIMDDEWVGDYVDTEGGDLD